MKLVVEAWRHLPQSFSVVNAFQCLELLRRPAVSLYHVEAALPPTSMLAVGKPWARETGLLPPAARAALDALPAPAPGLARDVTLRVHFPCDFRPAPSGRTLVFCVTESGPLPAYMSLPGQSPAALAAHENTHIVTPSAWSKRGLVRGGAPPARVHVVPHGIDPALYRPCDPARREAVRARLGWDGHFVFLNVSNLYPWKGTAVLLEAFAAVAARHPQAVLALKGTESLYASRGALGEAMGRLDAAGRALVTPRLRYTGGTHRFDELADLYGAADALAAPYHAEGFNLPVLEAMACGLPVVCTAGGPTDEFGGAGVTLPVRSREVAAPEPGRYQLLPDREHLVESMCRLVEDGALRQAVGSAASRHAHAHCTWRHAVDRLLEVAREGDAG